MLMIKKVMRSFRVNTLKSAEHSNDIKTNFIYENRRNNNDDVCNKSCCCFADNNEENINFNCDDKISI